MSAPNQFEDPLAGASEQEVMAALFANMVMQQAQTAYMFLGKSPNPDTGQTVTDLDTAKYFIDQLEMLAYKTKGNLDRQEQGLLTQSLTTLRLAFVEAMDGAGKVQPAPAPASRLASAQPRREEPLAAAQTSQPSPHASAPAPEAPAPAPAFQPGPAEESRKKFTKKY
jgi:hypothetical protein